MINPSLHSINVELVIEKPGIVLRNGKPGKVMRLSRIKELLSPTTLIIVHTIKTGGTKFAK